MPTGAQDEATASTGDLREVGDVEEESATVEGLELGRFALGKCNNGGHETEVTLTERDRTL